MPSCQQIASGMPLMPRPLRRPFWVLQGGFPPCVSVRYSALRGVSEQPHILAFETQPDGLLLIEAQSVRTGIVIAGIHQKSNRRVAGHGDVTRLHELAG